jgi:glucokinase
MSSPSPVPVLEIGGTHVTAALVDLARGGVVAGSASRRMLDGQASAPELLAHIVGCAATLEAPAGAAWGVAVPGPFDYETGIARFEAVGKFDALYGVDVGAVLRRDLPRPPASVTFLNDAVAFTIGEWAFGAGAGQERIVGITLGSGIGSGFLVDGRPVAVGPDVPTRGEVFRLRINGRPLEDTVSRRALLRAYARSAPGRPVDDVRELAERALDDDAAAQRVLSGAFTELGAALAPWLSRFRATAVVVGGAMTGSWRLIRPFLVSGINRHERLWPDRLEVLRAVDPERSALLGAAWQTTHTGDSSGADRF